MAGTTTYDFAGESAIVTGSTKGIGRGIAEGLADAGANVAINSRTPADVDAAAEEIASDADGRIVGVPADVGTADGIETLVETAVDAFGTVDLLVNNAAVWPREASVLEASLEDWALAMDVNVRSQLYASQLVARHMVEHDVRGSIVCHTSQTGDRRTGDRGLYGISKTAINGLIWRLAVEFAGYGIRVNGISTDVTDTHQLRSEAELAAAEEPETDPADVLAAWGEAVPLGRLGRPEDLANAVCFLASEQAEYVVGTILRVSGGGNLH